MNTKQVLLEQKYEIQNPLVEVPRDRGAVAEWLVRERGRGALGDERKIGEALDYLIEKAGDAGSVGWLDDKIGEVNRFSGGEPYSPYVYYDVVFMPPDGAPVDLGHASREGYGVHVTYDSFVMSEAGADALAGELLEKVLLPALERLLVRGDSPLGAGSVRNQDRRIGGMNFGAGPISTGTMVAISSSLGR
jgi:hypothetical protein